ncbi:TPA: sulfopyruvate decarboxylase subunit beta [bacterium]|nr:sulfopyruvate decarboxylase subunit beta [bacterium]
MKRIEVIKKIIKHLSDEDIAIFTTGMISREAFSIKDRRANFYMIGSMGLVSSVGLGMALNTLRKVVIFDGDGSALMDLGTLGMIGTEVPSNLIHIVLDNESYQSTGGQPTISKMIDLSSVAKAVGYKWTIKMTKKAELSKLPIFLKKGGPGFMLIKVERKGIEEIPRILHNPERLTERIREVLIS